MLLQKLKWMAVGVALTAASVWVYEHRDSFKHLGGSNRSAGIVSQVNPEFATYISAFTTGYISTGSTIKIKFANEFSGSTELNKALENGYFSFSPSIEGEAYWKDGQTMEFKPKERLKPGQTYKATFHLDKLVEVKKELQDFEFQFQAIKQSVKLETNELKSYNATDFNYYSLSGSIASADFAKPEIVEQLLQPKLDGKALPVKWMHNEKGTEHKFLIDSIERPSSSSSKLTIDCDASPLELSYKTSQTLTVPVKSAFQLLGAKAAIDNEQYVLLTFSNPVDQSQALEGLISLTQADNTNTQDEYEENGKSNDVKYTVSNNQVLVYPNKIKSGSYLLKVTENVKDAKGQALGSESKHNIVFEEVKPAIRFIGEGNILPSTGGLYIPFETVNLKAVDIKIIKIYENNILQFLQSNDLNGSSQLAQVGKKVIEKRLNLGITNPADFGTWKKSSIDISSLIKAEPGAIYKIYLSMKKAYSTYPCLGNSDNDKFEMEELKEPKEEEPAYFGYYYEDEYGGYYDESDGEDGYDWRERDNPCKSYYYRQYNRTVSKNILASDIGLTFKKGNDGSYLAVVNDLVSTDPMKDVTLELYDYQKQLITSLQTNKDGQAFISPTQRPYFIIAKKDKQRTYLRLDDGATLSLSMYDVNGDAIKKGLKGFIYGERGVWRPGDSLFLNFILEDKQSVIPANHPVVFELTNPQGQLYKRMISTKGVNGFYNFSTVTDKNAPTGLWNVDVKAGAAKFSKSIRVEAIMPNRLKIDISIGDNKLIIESKSNIVNLHTQWLTGAVAHGLAANVGISFNSTTTAFEKYKGFNFDDNTTRFESQNLTVFDGNVDDNGNTSFPLKTELRKNAPGFLKANVTTRVFEQGGAFSIDRFSLLYSPYDYYCGIKLPEGEKNTGILYTGKDHFVDIATADTKGNGVSRPNLRFELYKLEWRWWWDQYNDDLANYASDNYHKPVQVENFSSKNGSAKIKVNIKETQWGRYLLRVIDLDGGHTSTAITYFDWANWMERDGGNNKIVSNMLHFTTNKTSYKTGEEVSVTIPSPQNGRALVTIENGSRVLEAHWLETEKGSTVFKIKVTPQMAPNVYVHVSLIQPHARTNDLPIRLYGVVPITIDDPETHLKPVISMPATLMPEKKVDIVVSEENQKEMAFTLAVVDEGLLDITRFKTPDPWSTFYSKEAIGVKTWDIYENVIGAFGAELERILSIGGDGSETDNDDGAKANRFKPMVKFFGPYTIKKGEKKTISFQMPMYVGSVRTMVVAGNKGAYGMAEKTTPVKAPLMLLGTLPRVLSVTEEVKLPVTVFGGDKNIGKTDVKLEVNGLLQTNGSNLKTVNISKNDEKIVVFDLSVKNITGIAKAKITATGGGHTAVYEMELDVRNPNPYQTSVKDYFVDGGKELSENVTATGLPGTSKATLELSTIPPVNLEDRLHYLINYPHGCIEQTTSQVFAQLYLSDVIDLSAERKTEIEKNIKGGISDLQKFQLANGGMSYWPGMNEFNDWGTTYSGHFLILAEKKGYTLPSGFKKKWITFQQNAATNFEVNKNSAFNNDVLQAYRLYALSIAGQPVMSAMNRLREYNNLSNQARWLLAAAYAQAGQQDEAEKLVAKASTAVTPYTINYYTYGSTERDEALILEILCLLNKKTQAFNQLKKVSTALSSRRWMSTQSTAFGLISVASFIKKYGDASAMQALVSVNGKEITLKGNSAISQIPVTFVNNKANFLVKNNGKGVLYARLVTRGKPAIGTEEAGNENITMDVTYKDMNGALLAVDELPQGKDFIMQVNVRNLGLNGEIQNIALNAYMPSGWEIHNSRMDEDGGQKANNYTYQDIRDDKVLTYFDLGRTETKTFNITLNAAYEGRYYLPALNTEAMYDNSVFARNKGQWIKVVKKTNSGVASK